MPNLQSALGVFAILAIAWAISENRRAVPWRPVVVGLAVTIALALLMLKVPQAKIASCGSTTRSIALAAATRAGTAFVFGYVGGGPLPFEVKNPGNEFVLGFAGAAGGADHQRAVVAAVLLAHHAADRARFFLGAGKDARRRRRRGAVHRGEHFCRQCRGAAVHPAVSGVAVAQRNVHRHDRRHGPHRRHRVRALRHDPRPVYSRRRRPHRGRLRARRAGGDPDQPPHGARPRGEAYRRQAR